MLLCYFHSHYREFQRSGACFLPHSFTFPPSSPGMLLATLCLSLRPDPKLLSGVFSQNWGTGLFSQPPLSSELVTVVCFPLDKVLLLTRVFWFLRTQGVLCLVWCCWLFLSIWVFLFVYFSALSSNASFSPCSIWTQTTSTFGLLDKHAPSLVMFTQPLSVPPPNNPCLSCSSC